MSISTGLPETGADRQAFSFKIFWRLDFGFGECDDAERATAMYRHDGLDVRALGREPEAFGFGSRPRRQRIRTWLITITGPANCFQSWLTKVSETNYWCSWKWVISQRRSYPHIILTDPLEC